MKTKSFIRFWCCAALLIVLSTFFPSASANAASWQGIEPLKSRRADVERILGRPISESSNRQLTFKVMGGTASVSFVDENFVKTKKLMPELEGTVLQIILQHENSTDTPESMNLSKNRDLVRDDSNGGVIYRNLKDGIVYTFLAGKLKTTRYTFANHQIRRVRR